ncbi:MAG: efflux RND transporter permease subunit, partial [Candidatus Ornithomonoglobus sp.]
MTGKLIEGIIKRRVLIFILLAAVVIGGLYSYHVLPRTSFPKVDTPIATVTVVYPGATAEEVENEITKKVEDACQSVSGYDECRSQSMANACVVNINFDKKIPQEELDMDFIELRRKMRELQAELPSGVTAINVRTDAMDTASLVLAVTGNDMVSNDVLSQRAEDLSDKLKLIEGVSQIKISGSNDSEVSVKVDAQKLNRLNLSLYEICTIISANNAIIPIGDMTVDGSEISVDTSGRYESIDEIGNIILTATDDGTLLRLKDIADIEIKEPDDVSYYLFNDQKSIVVSLYFQDDLNVVSKADEVKAVISKFEESLSDNITINEVYFQSDDVKGDINNFIVSLIEAIIIVMLVIMIGMNRRNASIVAIAIPVIIFATFVMMKVFDVQIHFVSLAALIMVLGMLVDNSIVVSDSIQTCLDEGMERMEACRKGVSRVVLSVFLSMLTTVIVFASMFTLTGTYKQLASSIPSIAVISMIASFIVSLFVTPVFSYLFLKPASERNKGRKKPQKESLSVRLYRKIFSAAFKHRKSAILIVLAVFVFCASIASFSSMQLLPKTNKEYILVHITNQTQNDLTKTESITKQIQSIVMEQPETELVLSGIGICVPRYNFSVIDRGELDANGDICAKINLEKGGRFKKTYELVDYIQDEVDRQITGADVVVDELGIIPATDPPISVYVKGDDLEDINTVSVQAADILKSMEGVKGISNDRHYSTYGYYVNIDDKERNSLGLTNQEIQNELN